MNRGLVDLDELRRRFANGETSLVGNTSYCFVDGDKIIKVYGRKHEKGIYIPVERDKVIDLSCYKSDVIVFPDEYFVENGLPAGEISDYINNKNILESFNEEALLSIMINRLDPVIREIMLYKFLKMNDLCGSNILFSNELGYHIIDTTPWELAIDASKNNLNNLNKYLIETVKDNLELPVKYSNFFNKIDPIFYKNTAKFGKPGLELQKNIVLLTKLKFDFINLITAFMEAYRVYNGTDANTLGDVKEFVKVLKKG